MNFLIVCCWFFVLDRRLSFLDCRLHGHLKLLLWELSSPLCFGAFCLWSAGRWPWSCFFYFQSFGCCCFPLGLLALLWKLCSVWSKQCCCSRSDWWRRFESTDPFCNFVFQFWCVLAPNPDYPFIALEFYFNAFASADVVQHAFGMNLIPWP